MKSNNKPIALYALNNKSAFLIIIFTDGTSGLTGTRTTLSVILLPKRAIAWVRRLAFDAYHTPPALPRALRYVIEWRIQTIGVITDIALVTEQKSRFVMRLTTTFTNSAL
jgi:hypothetical protein